MNNHICNQTLSGFIGGIWWDYYMVYVAHRMSFFYVNCAVWFFLHAVSDYGFLYICISSCQMPAGHSFGICQASWINWIWLACALGAFCADTVHCIKMLCEHSLIMIQCNLLHILCTMLIPVPLFSASYWNSSLTMLPYALGHLRRAADHYTS